MLLFPRDSILFLIMIICIIATVMLPLTCKVPGERVLGSYALDEVQEFSPVYLCATSEVSFQYSPILFKIRSIHCFLMKLLYMQIQ